MEFAPEGESFEIYGGYFTTGLYVTESKKVSSSEITYKDKDQFYYFMKFLTSGDINKCAYVILEESFQIYLKYIDKEITEKLQVKEILKEKEGVEKFVSILAEYYSGIDIECEPEPMIMSLSSGAIHIHVIITPQSSLSRYKITYQSSSNDQEINSFSDFLIISDNILNLTPSTTYTIRLYTIDDVLVESQVVQTMPNIGNNYDKGHFLKGNNFDLSGLDFDSVSGLVNEIFDTGDELVIKNFNKNITFVKMNETLSISNRDAILFPFNTDSGFSQSATITLSDETSLPIYYDETTEEITINGSSYTSGMYFILDGKKVLVSEI